tara:strand:+ start:151 stop:324 length:174 start_codon:yes stop_codon:yes gene_type:complete
MNFFRKLIKQFLCPDPEECQCCQCQSPNDRDMDVDLANRIIQEMWDKEERYYKSISK